MDLKYVVFDDRYFNIRDILRAEFRISSRLLNRLKAEEKVFLNGVPSSLEKKLCKNDIIEVDLSFDEVTSTVVSTPMKLEIIYEDDYLLILNKPSGTPVHPSMRHFDSSLANGVKFYFDKIRASKED